MALSPFSSNPSFSSSSSSSFLHSSSLSFHFILRHSQIPSSIIFTPQRFKIHCSNNTIQVETQPPRRIRVDFEVKKKRKPRPSFLEQIRHKWSTKPISSTHTFPWQQQEQDRHHKQDEGEGEEEEEEEEEQVANQTSVSIPESTTDVTQAVPITRSISAPWAHGSQSRNTQFDFKPKTPNGEVINEISKISTDDTSNRNASTISIDEISDDSSEDEAEIDTVVLPVTEKRSTLSKKIVHSVSSDNDDNGRVDLPWKREPRRDSEVDAGQRRSKTLLAEQMLPEHELRRLRNISLRMVERIEVGVKGITQELLDSIHEKWKVDEVVKLKFEGPLTVNMKRAHEKLEVRFCILFSKSQINFVLML